MKCRINNGNKPTKHNKHTKHNENIKNTINATEQFPPFSQTHAALLLISAAGVLAGTVTSDRKDDDVTPVGVAPEASVNSEASETSGVSEASLATPGESQQVSAAVVGGDLSTSASGESFVSERHSYLTFSLFSCHFFLSFFSILLFSSFSTPTFFFLSLSPFLLCFLL